MQINKCLMLACALICLWTAAACRAADAAKASIPANLKSIGTALAIYAAEYNDRIPADLGMTLSYLSTPGHAAEGLQIIAPTKTAPDEIVQASIEKRRDWVNQNTIFQLLLPNGRFSGVRNPATTPLAIEKPGAEPTAEKLGVLYADGHVEVRPRAEVEAMMPPATVPATQPKP